MLPTDRKFKKFTQKATQSLEYFLPRSELEDAAWGKEEPCPLQVRGWQGPDGPGRLPL